MERIRVIKAALVCNSSPIVIKKIINKGDSLKKDPVLGKLYNNSDLESNYSKNYGL